MAKAVERELAAILGKAKGESLEVGEKELKLLKDRNRLLLDVSSTPLLLFSLCLIDYNLLPQ